MSWMPATGPERIMWIALIALVGAYLAGVWLNRQRSKAIGAWLQQGIGKLGGRVAWRWIRSMNSGAEVTVQEARPPFRQLQISYFLLTREFAPLCGIELLRGKRDLLSVRAELRKVPAQGFELVPSRGTLRGKLDAAAGEQPWQWQELSGGLGLGTRGRPSQALRGRVDRFTDLYGPLVERLSVRPRSPHLVAFLKLTGPQAQSSADLWRALGDLVE